MASPRKPRGPVMYSRAFDAAELLPSSVKAQSVVNALTKAGAPPAELQLSNMQQLLGQYAPQDRVPRDSILQHLTEYSPAFTTRQITSRGASILDNPEVQRRVLLAAQQRASLAQPVVGGNPFALHLAPVYEKYSEFAQMPRVFGLDNTLQNKNYYETSFFTPENSSLRGLVERSARADGIHSLLNNPSPQYIMQHFSAIRTPGPQYYQRPWPYARDGNVLDPLGNSNIHQSDGWLRYHMLPTELRLQNMQMPQLADARSKNRAIDKDKMPIPKELQPEVAAFQQQFPGWPSRQYLGNETYSWDDANAAWASIDRKLRDWYERNTPLDPTIFSFDFEAPQPGLASKDAMGDMLGNYLLLNAARSGVNTVSMPAAVNSWAVEGFPVSAASQLYERQLPNSLLKRLRDIEGPNVADPSTQFYNEPNQRMGRTHMYDRPLRAHNPNVSPETQAQQAAAREAWEAGETYKQLKTKMIALALESKKIRDRINQGTDITFLRNALEEMPADEMAQRFLGPEYAAMIQRIDAKGREAQSRATAAAKVNYMQTRGGALEDARPAGAGVNISPQAADAILKYGMPFLALPPLLMQGTSSNNERELSSTSR